MHTRWFVGFSLLALVASPAAGAWRVEVPGGRAEAVTHDGTGDIVAAGQVFGDFTVMKLGGADGAEIWRHDVDGTWGGDDGASSVVADGAGDVIAAGSLYNTTTYRDFVVMKLDGPTGAELWRQELDGPVSLFDAAYTVVVDAAGDVVAAGQFETNATYPGGYDMAIVKLAGGTGAELWRTTLAGTLATGISQDSVYQVVTDGAGNVLVAGLFENTGSRTELAVAKLSGTTGAELWRREIDGDFDYDLDVALAVVVNPAGDVFGAGRVNDDFTVVKLAGATGNQLWRTDIPGRGLGSNDTATSLALDSSGDVVAAGLLRQDGQGGNVGDFDFLVARLEGSTGAEVWRYETDRALNDLANDVVIDGAGDVIAVGHFESVRTFWDFTAVKLDGDTGSERWVQRIDGTTALLDEQQNYYFFDEARAVTVTPGGAIAVAGVLHNSSGGSFSVLTFAELDGTVGPVRGMGLDVRDYAGVPSRRRLTTVLRDQAITIPPPGSGGDPRTGGATVRLVNPTTLEAADVVLPSGAAWRALGNPPGRRGYVYSDTTGVNGPCRSLRAKPGILRAVCAGAIPFSLDEPSQGSLAASIRLGTADPQCAVFDGNVSKDAGTGSPGPAGAFKAGAAFPANGACP